MSCRSSAPCRRAQQRRSASSRPHRGPGRERGGNPAPDRQDSGHPPNRRESDCDGLGGSIRESAGGGSAVDRIHRGSRGRPRSRRCAARRRRGQPCWAPLGRSRSERSDPVGPHGLRSGGGLRSRGPVRRTVGVDRYGSGTRKCEPAGPRTQMDASSRRVEGSVVTIVRRRRSRANLRSATGRRFCRTGACVTDGDASSEEGTGRSGTRPNFLF